MTTVTGTGSGRRSVTRRRTAARTRAPASEAAAKPRASHRSIVGACRGVWKRRAGGGRRLESRPHEPDRPPRRRRARSSPSAAARKNAPEPLVDRPHAEGPRRAGEGDARSPAGDDARRRGRHARARRARQGPLLREAALGDRDPVLQRLPPPRRRHGRPAPTARRRPTGRRGDRGTPELTEREERRVPRRPVLGRPGEDARGAGRGADPEPRRDGDAERGRRRGGPARRAGVPRARSPPRSRARPSRSPSGTRPGPSRRSSGRSGRGTASTTS